MQNLAGLHEIKGGCSLGLISEAERNVCGAPIGRMTAIYYVLLLLCCVYSLNFSARQILNLFVSTIEAEFHVSDTTVGVLTGPGFVTFYVLLGLPIACWSDPSGMIQQVCQFACARVSVGIGETGGTPNRIPSSRISSQANRSPRRSSRRPSTSESCLTT